NISEVDEGTAFFAKSIDQFNLAVLGKVLTESLFAPRFVKVADVNVARSTSRDSKCNSWGKCAGMLAPTNLETTIVNHKALEVAECIEACSSSRVNEGNKADMLVGNIANMMKKPTTNNIANFLNS